MTPVAMPFQESHCKPIPSCESKALVSNMLPSGAGTLINRPSVRTPSTSMSSSLIRAARCLRSAVELFIELVLSGKKFLVSVLILGTGREHRAGRGWQCIQAVDDAE